MHAPSAPLLLPPYPLSHANKPDHAMQGTRKPTHRTRTHTQKKEKKRKGQQSRFTFFLFSPSHAYFQPQSCHVMRPRPSPYAYTPRHKRPIRCQKAKKKERWENRNRNTTAHRPPYVARTHWHSICVFPPKKNNNHHDYNFYCPNPRPYPSLSFPISQLTKPTQRLPSSPAQKKILYTNWLMYIYILCVWEKKEKKEEDMITSNPPPPPHLPSRFITTPTPHPQQC